MKQKTQGNLRGKLLAVLGAVLLLTACATSHTLDPIESSLALLDDIESGVESKGFMELLHESRTWVPPKALGTEPVELGTTAEIPVQFADIKLIGPSLEDALRSLALKIWMIESAEHTVDAVYYIFTPDMVGLAMLGALCNAVQRGVDVRLIVDSVGSGSIRRDRLRALESCAEEAGYMRDALDSTTKIKARAQVVVFNALSNPIARINRRSHDKMIVSDGAFPSKSRVLTGGRNISTAYYGVSPEGTVDPKAYQDLEILLQTGKSAGAEELTVGNLSETYFTLLFLNEGNKKVNHSQESFGKADDEILVNRYNNYRAQAQQALETVKKFSLMKPYFADMPEFAKDTFSDSEVLLVHELANLTDRSVVRDAVDNRDRNRNSIMRFIYDLDGPTADDRILRIVSPYVFMTKYTDKDGSVTEDTVDIIHRWLDEHPDNRLEIITNSVMTSDNIMTQSVIDMEVGPRLLLSPEMQEIWLSGRKHGEMNPEVTNSYEWRKLVDHPQIFIYQTGKLDSSMLGGDTHYSKMHAKFLIGDEIGFVGTSNFDYRSILYNNEMGFFFRQDAAHRNLNEMFDYLKARSYRWGSPEWLQMRSAVMNKSGMKAWGTRKQRFLYKLLKNTGLIWQM